MAAIHAALDGHRSMKQVTIVDTDIDCSNPVRVEWALMTRWQPDKDTVILSKQKGSSLDPSRDENGLTSKIGIDATLPPSIERKPYESSTMRSYDGNKPISVLACNTLEGV